MFNAVDYRLVQRAALVVTLWFVIVLSFGARGWEFAFDMLHVIGIALPG